MRDVFRRFVGASPLRWLRDGMLRAGHALDPKIEVLAPEIEWRIEQAIDALPTWSWHRLDRVYARIRRSLLAQELQGRPNWRKGPVYGLMVARFFGERLAAVGDVTDKVFMDLGCGAHNPFGTAAAMFLNGARETVSLDLAKLDRARCAEALFDLLGWSALFPEKVLWSGIEDGEFRRRLALFDSEALAYGDLDRGLARVPMKYMAHDIHGTLPVPAGSVDVMTSRDVLEHFLDFPRAIGRIAEMLRPGAISVHHIDLADHRMYRDLDPEDFTVEERARRQAPRREVHAWSFLAEPEAYSDGLCNRLRASEFRRLFQDNGFEILRDEPERSSLPAGFRDRLSPRYRVLSEEDLETVRVTLVLRKT